MNLCASDWKRIAIPLEANGRYSRCKVFANPGDPNDTNAIQCEAWDYDPERAKCTIVSEWNLVCRRSSLKTLAKAIFMAGGLGFLVISGYCADRYGCRPVVFGCASVVLIATLGCCFALSYPVYVWTRFLVSGCTVSLYAQTVTISAESCSYARRPTLLSSPL